jgi:hypothetical protein
MLCNIPTIQLVVFIKEIRVFRDLVPCRLVEWHQSLRENYALNYTSSRMLHKDRQIYVRRLYNLKSEDVFVVLLVCSLR